MKVYAKDRTRNDRPAANGKRTGPDGRKQNADARPVFIDLDDAIRDGTGRRPEEIIVEDGRDIFRRIETETLWSILREGLRPGGEEVPRDASGGGIILAAGGGIVEREENRDLLRENGRVKDRLREYCDPCRHLCTDLKKSFLPFILASVSKFVKGYL